MRNFKLISHLKKTKEFVTKEFLYFLFFQIVCQKGSYKDFIWAVKQPKANAKEERIPIPQPKLLMNYPQYDDDLQSLFKINNY